MAFSQDRTTRSMPNKSATYGHMTLTPITSSISLASLAASAVVFQSMLCACETAGNPH
jgi:hypothetical protein